MKELARSPVITGSVTWKWAPSCGSNDEEIRPNYSDHVLELTEIDTFPAGVIILT